MEDKKMSIGERLDFIEFRQELLFINLEVERLIFEYNINRDQYNKIMDMMDDIRQNIYDGVEVFYENYEERMYQIARQLRGDYHFCEYLAEAFMNDERWVEVYPALYDKMPKYEELFDL